MGATPTCRASRGTRPLQRGQVLPLLPLLGEVPAQRGIGFWKPLCHSQACDISPMRGDKGTPQSPAVTAPLRGEPRGPHSEPRKGRVNPLLSTDARGSIRSARLRLGMRTGELIPNKKTLPRWEERSAKKVSLSFKTFSRAASPRRASARGWRASFRSRFSGAFRSRPRRSRPRSRRRRLRRR